MKRLLALVLIPLIVGIPVAESDDKGPLVSKRQKRQQAQIDRGIRSGDLTQEEAAALQDQQRAIAKRRQNMEADGKLSKTERKLLRYEQQSARNALKRERGDAQTQ